MDGQYGNIAFVCTQTDDVEATEIWRDHQDVSALDPERHTMLHDLFAELDVADAEEKRLLTLSDQNKVESRGIREQLRECKQMVSEAEAEIEQWQERAKGYVFGTLRAGTGV